MPRGRPKGAKNKKPLVADKQAAPIKRAAAPKKAEPPKEAAPAKKKASGRPKGSKNKATIARREERQQHVQHIAQPEITLETLQRLSADQIKGQEKLTWGKWPELDIPVYIAGHGNRQYSFACPFESGNDGGVLVVDYKERHDKIPSAKYRVESRYVYYKPTAK